MAFLTYVFGYNMTKRLKGGDMELEDIRKKYKLSQDQAAQIARVPLRTYIRYEKDDSYGNILKRERIIELINEECEITETKGILTLTQIIEIVKKVFDEEYSGKIEFCYLFGSYAKGYAKGESDIDLCISTEITGLEFFGLIELLRESLHKLVDLIRIKDLSRNIQLIEEIMKDGIKIY